MGLDTVAIVLRVEETFGVDLPDDELGSVSTVGDLYQLLLSKLDGSHACLSSRAFFRVRRSMVQVLGLKRASIRPTTELEPILVRASRRTLWKRIERHAGLRLPILREPAWSRWPLFLLGAGVYVFVSLRVILLLGGFRSAQLGILSVAIAALAGPALQPFFMGAIWLTMPFLRYALPVATAGELARGVLDLNYRQIKQGDSSANLRDDQQVWRVLRSVIVDELQIKPEEVVPEARFGRDLGAD